MSPEKFLQVMESAGINMVDLQNGSVIPFGLAEDGEFAILYPEEASYIKEGVLAAAGVAVLKYQARDPELMTMRQVQESARELVEFFVGRVPFRILERCALIQVDTQEDLQVLAAAVVEEGWPGLMLVAASNDGQSLWFGKASTVADANSTVETGITQTQIDQLHALLGSTMDVADFINRI